MIIKSDNNAAIIATMVKVVIGIGGCSSAIIGDNIEAILAPILHMPKAVPANIAGNSWEFAR